MERVLLSLARKISPSMVVGPLSQPYLLSPLIASAQVRGLVGGAAGCGCRAALQPLRLAARHGPQPAPAPPPTRGWLQMVNVSLPGEEPDLEAACEDMRLFDARLTDDQVRGSCPKPGSSCPKQPRKTARAHPPSDGCLPDWGACLGPLPGRLVVVQGRAMDAEARRRHFNRPASREGREFDTEHVWTFGVWQQFVNLALYELNFGLKYSLVQHLNSQPLQVGGWGGGGGLSTVPGGMGGRWVSQWRLGGGRRGQGACCVQGVARTPAAAAGGVLGC